MYIRPDHAELDVPTLQAFIKQYPLGLFTTSIPHPDYDTLQTTHVPFVIDPSSSSSPDDKGILRGHMARINPQSKAILHQLNESSSSSSSSYSGGISSWFSSSPATPTSKDDPCELKDEVLVLFQAPTHSYVTPNFYVETKPDSHKVVPTWDFAAVQVYGKAKIYHLPVPETSEFLQRQLEDLTNQREESMFPEEEGKRWKVGDAPESYVEGMKRGIIGIEIRITKIQGRFKLSQEKSGGDWKGVVDGFRGLGTPEGARMADMIEKRGKL